MFKEQKKLKLDFIEKLENKFLDDSYFNLQIEDKVDNSFLNISEKMMILNVYLNFIKDDDAFKKLCYLLKTNRCFLSNFSSQNNQYNKNEKYSKYYQCKNCLGEIEFLKIEKFPILEFCVYCESEININNKIKSSKFFQTLSSNSCYTIHKVLKINKKMNPFDVIKIAFLFWHLIMHSIFFLIFKMDESEGSSLEKKSLKIKEYLFPLSIQKHSEKLKILNFKGIPDYLSKHIKNDINLITKVFSLKDSYKLQLSNLFVKKIFDIIKSEELDLKKIDNKRLKKFENNIFNQTITFFKELSLKEYVKMCFNFSLNIRKNEKNKLSNEKYRQKLEIFEWINKSNIKKDYESLNDSSVNSNIRENQRLMRKPVFPALKSLKKQLILEKNENRAISNIIFYFDFLKYNFRKIMKGIIPMIKFMNFVFSGKFSKAILFDITLSSIYNNRKKARDSDKKEKVTKNLYQDLKTFNKNEGGLKIFLNNESNHDQKKYIQKLFELYLPIFKYVYKKFRSSIKTFFNLDKHTQLFILGKKNYEKFEADSGLDNKKFKANQISLKYLINYKEKSTYNFSFLNTLVNSLANIQNDLLSEIGFFYLKQNYEYHNFYSSIPKNLLNLEEKDLLSFDDRFLETITDTAKANMNYRKEDILTYDMAFIKDFLFTQVTPRFPKIDHSDSKTLFSFTDLKLFATTQDLEALKNRFGFETTIELLSVSMPTYVSCTVEDEQDFDSINQLIFIVLESSEYTKYTKLSTLVNELDDLDLHCLQEFPNLYLEHIYSLYCYLEAKLAPRVIEEIKPNLCTNRIRNIVRNMGFESHFIVSSSEYQSTDSDPIMKANKSTKYQEIKNYLKETTRESKGKLKVRKNGLELFYLFLVRFYSRYLKYKKYTDAHHCIFVEIQHVRHISIEWFKKKNYKRDFLKYIKEGVFTILSSFEFFEIVRNEFKKVE